MVFLIQKGLPNCIFWHTLGKLFGDGVRCILRCLSRSCFLSVGVTFGFHFRPSWPPKDTLHAGTSPYRKARWLFKCKQRAIWIQKRFGLHFGTCLHLLFVALAPLLHKFIQVFEAKVLFRKASRLVSGGPRKGQNSDCG